MDVVAEVEVEAEAEVGVDVGVDGIGNGHGHAVGYFASVRARWRLELPSLVGGLGNEGERGGAWIGEEEGVGSLDRQGKGLQVA